MPPEGSGIRTWQWVVTAIVVIVLIVIGIMVFGNKGTDTTGTDTGTTTDSGVAQTGVNSVVISDQYPGNVVYVSSVQLQKGGWVAIHENASGQPGAIIGQTYVAAGVNPARVTVSKPIVDGRTYYAMLHSDDGDRQFDASKDLPLKDASGNIIMRIFRGSATADQNIKG